jgi:polyhydroxyalkanoate synthesis repressor PhaR
VSLSAAAALSERVIKKYPNRRLYDTTRSAYVTLAEIRDLVMASEPVVVRDAKTGENLTRSILLQIILEEEAAGTPMFSEELLASLIRFYGQAMHGFMGPFLEQQLKLLAEWQSRVGDQARTLSPEAWGQMLRQWPSPFLGGTSTELVTEVQKQLQKNAEQVMGVFGIKR